MYILDTKKYKLTYGNGSYEVYINPKAVAEQRKVNKATGIAVEIQEPNYFLVNTKTGAIELTSDQLPTMIEAANHLNSLLDRQLNGKPANEGVEPATKGRSLN